MSWYMRFASQQALSFTFASALFLTLPAFAVAATVANPLCPNNTALFNPDTGSDIMRPSGFKVSVFAKGLNFPTGIAFLRHGERFDVYVLESGHGLPSVCNEQSKFGSGDFDPKNPFTPDILVFNQSGTLLRTLAKPTATDGFRAGGPAGDIAFEKGLAGGRLFATDSNQATHAQGQNNSSRIVTVDPMTGHVTPFITGLPTGDHPTEQLAFKGNWIYWSQGSTTNSGVVGRDNGGGTNQQDIPCQDIVLSDNVFDSGDGVFTSGYSPFGTPDYHGWPDRYGFLPSSQAVFNPVGGPGDDLCVPAANPPSLCTPASLAKILSEDVPVRDVLKFPPQQITSPLAIEAADSSFTGIDFVPNSFANGPVSRGAALYSLEGDFGFSAANATDPAPEVGHEVKLINFSKPGEPLELKILRFAFNKTTEQAFVSGISGFNRPTNVKFGPDGCAYVVDYGAVRDFGQSDTEAKFVGVGNGPLVQIPGTGVIWKICSTAQAEGGDD